MLEKFTKTVVTIVALGFLFWVFWNPTPKKAKSKATKDKTEVAAKKLKSDKNANKKSRSKKRKNKGKKPAKKSKENRQSVTDLPEPTGDSAYLVVTGNVRSVRFRASSGKIFGPGDVPPGTYDILTRQNGEVIEHGEVEVEAGDRKRIDCNDDGCQLWKSKRK